MEVKVKLFCSTTHKVVELEHFLEPRVAGASDGAVEQAAALAELNATVLGRLTACLVEKGVLRLDEAMGICGSLDTVTHVFNKEIAQFVAYIPFEEEPK